MRFSKSVLSKRYNKPKQYDGHKNLITGESHRHTKENVRRLWRKAQLRFRGTRNEEPICR